MVSTPTPLFIHARPAVSEALGEQDGCKHCFLCSPGEQSGDPGAAQVSEMFWQASFISDAEPIGGAVAGKCVFSAANFLM